MTEGQGWTLIGAVFMVLASNLENEVMATIVAAAALVIIVYGPVSHFLKNGRSR